MQQELLFANNSLGLLCIDFMQIDPSKDGEDVLMLTETFANFSQVFITNNQKVHSIAKILVGKWFYIYGIPSQIHSD